MSESVPSQQGSARRRRATTFVVLAVVSALLLSYATALLWVGSEIPRGTTVAGVDIGGLDDVAAVQRLDDQLAERAASVSVDVDGRVRSFPASRFGLQFDPEASVDAVPRREALSLRLMGQVFGQEVDPAIDVDARQLTRGVRALARRVEQPVRQPRIGYDGSEVVTVAPRAGVALDRAAAAAAIADSYLVDEEPVALAVETVEPLVSESELDETAATAAVEAVSAPVTLQVDGATLTVEPEQIAAVLTFQATEDGMEPRVDGAALRELLGEPLAEVGTPAVDASFDVSSGTPKVVPGKAGFGVDDQQLADGLVAALAADDRRAELEMGKVVPDLTTREAKDLGVNEVVSTFTQEFPYAAYRVTNIGVAAEKITGTVLEPGETFSLNGVVGERTPENGFVKGYIIVGNRLVEDYGGAVSTITTAMWHTAFYAGMTRVEQRAHGFWISRYLPGLEATVSWGNLDLKFRNDTPYGVLITASVTDTSVTTTMWSTKYWDIKAEFGPRTNIRPAGTVYDPTEGCVAQYGVDGFDIVVTRVWSRDGKVERREPLSTSYSAAPTVICSAKPDPKPSDEPSDKPNDKPSDKPSDKPADSGQQAQGGSGGGGNSS
jgi:vancomycin resistance protein YoaR